MVPARWNAVVPSQLCTRIENASGVSVSTVEHVVAALAGCGIHNALIEISGPEVPILDGSAAPFVTALLRSGVRTLPAPMRALEVIKNVEVREGAAMARLEPSPRLEIGFEIAFPDAAIGQQAKRLDMANGAFIHALCDSRTFCRYQDVEAMRQNGLALGGTLANAVVVDGDQVLSPGGLRHPDEPVRHKMLDAMGDLALAGAPILARYTGVRAGHSLTNRLMRAVFSDRDAFRAVTCGPEILQRLPGYGVGQADLAGVMEAA